MTCENCGADLRPDCRICGGPHDENKPHCYEPEPEPEAVRRLRDLSQNTFAFRRVAGFTGQEARDVMRYIDYLTGQSDEAIR